MFFNKNTEHTLQRLCTFFLFLRQMAGGGGENDASNKGKESAIETMRTFERVSKEQEGRGVREQKAVIQGEVKMKRNAPVFRLC